MTLNVIGNLDLLGRDRFLSSIFISSFFSCDLLIRSGLLGRDRFLRSILSCNFLRSVDHLLAQLPQVGASGVGSGDVLLGGGVTRSRTSCCLFSYLLHTSSSLSEAVDSLSSSRTSVSSHIALRVAIFFLTLSRKPVRLLLATVSGRGAIALGFSHVLPLLLA